MTNLPKKHQSFVDEYLIDLNATQAAIRAGYSEKTAYSQGQRLLKNVEIQKAISERFEARAVRTKIDSDYVLMRLHEIDQMDVADILTADGCIKPIADWPKCWRQSISAIDVNEILAPGDDDKAAISVLKKIKWPDKLKNLELLGKHVDVNAFGSKVDSDEEEEPTPVQVNVNIIDASKPDA